MDQVFMRFFHSDSTGTNTRLLRDSIRCFAHPQAIYADRASHFRTTRAADLEEQPAGRPPQTQIGRALRELRIVDIPVHSPQAKGRVERSFGTLQDRLVQRPPAARYQQDSGRR